MFTKILANESDLWRMTNFLVTMNDQFFGKPTTKILANERPIFWQMNNQKGRTMKTKILANERPIFWQMNNQRSHDELPTFWSLQQGIFWQMNNQKGRTMSDQNFGHYNREFFV